MKYSSVPLGDFAFEKELFPNLEVVLSPFDATEFKGQSARKRFRKINESLLQLIQASPRESFLLAAVVHYIQSINEKKILDEHYTFTLFEFWLNRFSGLTGEENREVRAKIAGKLLPREDYQVFFPIGMGEVYPGTHFAVAHLSPDADTMVASFWGWLDAFAARVGDSLHVWSLPGGPPISPISQLFHELFGQTCFSSLARTAGTLTLNSMDLVNQANLIKEKGATLVTALDHGYREKAVILVDEQGHYQGDWRTHDIEPVRQVIMLFNACMRWFENNLHVQLISLFSKQELTTRDLPSFLKAVFEVPISSCEPVKDLGERQRQDLHMLLSEVLIMEKGLEGTFFDLSQALSKRGVSALSQFHEAAGSLHQSDLFDERGVLIEERPRMFNRLQKLLVELDQAILTLRDFIERLDIVIEIKHHVLGKRWHYLTTRNDVEEIRLKMGNYDYLTVVIPEEEDRFFPIGVIWAHALRKGVLGTVSLRDFSNYDEVRMPSYLTVISVIDHHKSSLKTISPPMALIGDAQSCNVMVAEQTFLLNTRYSLGGMTLGSINDQINRLRGKEDPLSTRLLKRLFERRLAAERGHTCYIHPQRELTEYFCFLQAILDDTDLLTKVSYRDIQCVVRLLNEMKTIEEGQEKEVINLDHLPRDGSFARAGAKELLQNVELYSLYRKVYAYREKEVSDNLHACAEGLHSNTFEDVKEQNGCCRVGQTKMFSSNFPLFKKMRTELQRTWLKLSQQAFEAHPEIDLHLHMISTISSAEEVFHNAESQSSHQDELWIWIPPTERAQDHLAIFLAAFREAPEILNNELELEVSEDNGTLLLDIFERNFLPLPRKSNGGLPLAVLHYLAGSLNSRKSMITPYLPRLVT